MEPVTIGDAVLKTVLVLMLCGFAWTLWDTRPR